MRKTLFIGLGGLGQRVVARIKKQAEEIKESTAELGFIVIDRDAHDLETVATAENIPAVCLYEQQLIRELVRHYHGLGVEDWMPDAPAVLHTAPLSTGMRAVGRLDFIHALHTERLTPLVEQLHMLLDGGEHDLRIVVVTSLAGGTGSGMFIQLAAWLRKTLRMRWNKNPEIYGLFAGPEVFTRTGALSLTACERFRANGYAALRELELFTKVAQGESVPGFEDRMLDGQQLGAWEQSPVYDWISVYEDLGEEQVTFEQHLDRMATGTLLLHTSKLLPMAVGIDALRARGVRLVAVGAAVAQFPKWELLEHCSLRGLPDLIRQNAGPVTEAESQTLQEQAARIAASVREAVRRELDVFTPPLADFEKSAKELKTAEVEEFIHTVLRDLVRRMEKAEEELSHYGEELFRRLHGQWLPEGNIITSTLLYDGGEPLPPAKLKKRLELLKAKLEAELNALKELPRWNITQPGTIPLPAGVRVEGDNAGSPYPLWVWEQLQANAKLLLLLSNKKEKYIRWFGAYCEGGLTQMLMWTENRVLRTVFSRLLKEADGLLQAMTVLDQDMHRLFVRTWEKHEAQETNPDTVRICGDLEEKTRVYEDITPKWDMARISSCYLSGLVRVLGEWQWQSRKGIEACAAETFREILRCVSDEMRRAGAAQFGMDITEACCYGQASTYPWLDRLCQRLKAEALTRAEAMKGSVRCHLGEQPSAFGVVSDSHYGSELRNIVENQLRDYLVEEADQKGTVLWCLHQVWGMKLSDCSMDAWREAYEWMCRRAKNPGEAHFEPHMDKRWATELFGME